MLILRLTTPLLEHLLADVAHHFLVVALQIYHAVEPLLFDLDLPLHACDSVDLLLELLLGIPLPGFLNPLLKPESGSLHISLDAPILDCFFLCLDTFGHVPDTREQL